MPGYTVNITDRAQRDIAALAKVVMRRVATAIDGLAANPRPPGALALSGHADLYRVRVGDYRVIYLIADAVLVVTVVRVRHRREAYRGM